MPGNEHGDRVHNFFAQDNSSQGQHQSHVGNWPVLNNNLWVGSQRQIDVLNSSNRSYSSQNSETDRLQASYPVHATHSLNFPQPNLKPDFSKSQSLNEQQSSNGFIYGNQFYQTRQNETNFLAVDSDLGQSHLIASRGLPVHELQRQSGQEQQAKTSDRPEASSSPGSFDLFGGQQQMSHQQASMLQAFQRQQSGLNDMQQLQQQLMIRKMQELQRQQQLWQPDLMPQNSINQVPSFAEDASCSQSSTLVNGTPNSDALHPWTAEPGKNWLSCGSSAMQGSSSGLFFSPKLGQTQRSLDVVPQQVNQSLYGVPVSSSRGLTINQYSQMVTDRSSMPEMATSSNSHHGNQHNFLPDQIGRHEGTSSSRQKFQNVNIGHASSQSVNTGIVDIGGLQQVNSMQRNATQQDFPGRQELPARLETSRERSTRQVSESGNEVTLDPAEEKILYGSDDNIWSAFGKSPNMSDEVGNLFDHDGSSNGFPSLQSGSWSALMQSAVAETSSSDVRAQEWSGLDFHNPDGSSANQPNSMHIDNVKQASMPNDSMRIHSALSSGSNPLPDSVSTLNVVGLNQLGHKYPNELCQRVLTDTSQRFGQSLEEAREWSNRIPLQKSGAEGSQIYGNASQHSLDAERNTKTISATWAMGQSGTRQPPNGWSALAAVPPDGNRLLNIPEAEKLPQNSQSNQVRVMQGEVVNGSSLWKSNSVIGSSTELFPVHKGALSLNDASASVANSCNMGVGDGTGEFVQNKDLLSQWKNASPSANVERGEGLGRMLDQVSEYNHGFNLLSSNKDEVARHDMENCAMKESSNDSHHSNLSQHASGGFRESELLDASDSRSLPPAKQKSTNQLASKVSALRKFQYHPMGNLDEDVEPTYGQKQRTQVQATSLQNTHFGHSKLFNQISRNSRGTEKGDFLKDNKRPEQEPSHGSFPDYAPNAPVPFSRPSDSYINKSSSPSQNMLELLHKVDQSRDNGAIMHSSPGCNISSQLPEAEKFDVSAGRIQRSQSSASQGFGLQLGPPSQRLQIPDLSSRSQDAQGSINLMHTSHAGSELGEKGLLMPTSSVPSLPYPSEESQIEFEKDRSAGPGHPGKENSLYKAPGNYHPVYSSDTCARSQRENKITRVSGKVDMDQHIDSSFSCNTSHSMQRGYAETVLPDACHNNTQKDNLALSGGTAQQTGPYDVQERGPAATALTRNQMCSSQQFGMPVISQQGSSSLVLDNMWTNVPAFRHTLAAQYPKTPSQLSELPQPNFFESNSQGLDFSKGGHLSSELSALHANTPGVFDGEEPRLKEISGQLASSAYIDSVPEKEESLGKASSIKNRFDDSPANSTSRQKDIEAFGRSLKTNIFSNKKHALLNQMRAMKEADSDPSIRVSKRMRGSDNVLNVRQVHLMAGLQTEDNVEDTLGSSTGVPSEDSRMPSFSTSDMLQSNSSPHGNVASHDAVVAGMDASWSNPSTDCSTSVMVEHNQVSPRMAPSRFNRYGSVKDGHVMPVHNAQNFTSLRPEEPSFNLEKSSSVLVSRNLEETCTVVPIDAGQVGSTLVHSAPTSEANEHLSSQSLQLDVTDQNQVILGPKKHESATCELYPWHKEISNGSQEFSILSVAEANWNKAANSLTEKVEDDADFIEDGSPVLRSKRRLVLTTQLMQQLFHPPPATILSADASTKYECVTYAVSRVALGGTCRSVSRSSDLGLPHDGVNLHSIKGKLNGDPRLTKIIEELWGKARKLENDFLRLDKSASLLDLRLECQDLEKFSVINRFAKFHGRGQTDNAETSSNHVTATTQNVQRYVTAVPLPRSLPDRVQCLSL